METKPRAYRNSNASERVNINSVSKPIRVIDGKIVELKVFKPECYFKDPITGQEGWSIEFPKVLALTKKEAKDIIKKMPNFDCFIELGW